MSAPPTILESNDRTNRWIRRLAVVVGALLLLVASTGLGVELAGLQSGNRARSALIGCTTPGPKPPPVTGHACFDRGAKNLSEAIAELRKSIDCVALYSTGDRPPACTATDARMDLLKAGGDPFAPTATTTTPKGTP